MMSREKIVSNIKIQLEYLDKMKAEIDNKILSLNKIIDLVQDDSKLGATSAFDFGKNEEERWIKDFEKKIVRGILKIKKYQKLNEELQKQGESFTASLLDDSVEKE
ncbi:MAG TPA: hypothetical protein PKY81_13150 [bacterium]|nr:hypothetical protein [bacterium]HPN31894.1 hypothetical protein [bacterium]